MWGVWTVSTLPEWIKRNAGVEGRLIHICRTKEEADALGQRLCEIYGDKDIFVRKV